MARGKAWCSMQPDPCWPGGGGWPSVGDAACEQTRGPGERRSHGSPPTAAQGPAEMCLVTDIRFQNRIWLNQESNDQSGNGCRLRLCLGRGRAFGQIRCPSSTDKTRNTSILSPNQIILDRMAQVYVFSSNSGHSMDVR